MSRTGETGEYKLESLDTNRNQFYGCGDGFISGS